MKKFMNIVGVALVLTTASLSASATPVTLGVDGNADCTFGCVARYQQVYESSAFGSGPINIGEVDFFAAGGFSIAGSRTFKMSISTSKHAVGALSTQFASNVGADNVLFATSTFSGSPHLDDLFAFVGSFNYDPSAGDLLIDIVSLDGGRGGAPYAMASNAPGIYDRAYSFNSTVTADAANESGYGDRTRFVIGAQANNVPEPGTIALVGLGLVAAFGVRRRAARA